ncbi:MAG TPA: rod shape-determining protein MreC [Candidatus Faecalibacterium faecipullorum]|uniref:Cell shape-determining protein MreC n=1 Tax=Candidatus Faecalibacterium faecipullorum TaxID=2838578 RepID=A0A9D2MDD6_9FIRM|nr:rod shape-determining protein MreC [Candidatus Faecalibacterium faecipullorum]
MAYAAANGRLTAAPQELLSVAAAPFQKAAAWVSGGIVSVWDKYTSIDETMEENEALRAENAELRRQLADYDKLRAENEAFKNLAGIQEDNPEMTFVSAFVIGRDALDPFGGFTLDQGTVHGVERGDTVIDDQGRLLGTVIEAGLTSSRVLTLLHPSFNAAGVVSRTRDNGILTGDAAYAPDGQCVFTDLSRESMASVGDEVITTGLGGVYPPDILVGRIVSIEPEASGTSVVAVIQPDADVLGARHAFIITDY